MKHVLVEGPLHARGMDLLKARSDIEVDLRDKMTADDLAAAIPDIDALILRLTPMNSQMIAGAGKLKVISRLGVGYDHVDVEALTSKGIILAIARDSLAISVAEHSVMLMLGVSRQIALMDRYTRTGEYGQRYKNFGHEVFGKTVLIIGLGGIGLETARRCQALGMKIVASGRDSSRQVAAREGYDFAEDFRAALPSADFVSLHLPASDDGSSLLSTPEFAAMKPGAYVINTARGSLIDEDALHAALTSGTLGGAGLDVTMDEPPKDDCPLLKLDNVLFTPHNSALCTETIERVSVTCVSSLLAALDGTMDPAFAVNPEVL